MKRTAVRLLGVCLSVLLAGGGFASCNKRDVPTSESKTEEVEAPQVTTVCPEEITEKPEVTEATEKPEESEKPQKPEKPEEPEKTATEELIYELLSDETYEVTGLQSKDLTEVVIPATYKGKAVTSIGDSAFCWCTGLTSITIPNSVTSIGNSAFENCTGLTSITISDSVTSIGEGAFGGCIGLTSIHVAENNSIYHSAGNCLIETESKILIAGCKNSVIPTDGSMTSIGRLAFSGCRGLTGITIPNSVTHIGGNAFFRCTGLTGITIPNSVTEIGSAAFIECTGLTSIRIPDSVASIGDCAIHSERDFRKTQQKISNNKENSLQMIA